MATLTLDEVKAELASYDIETPWPYVNNRRCKLIEHIKLDGSSEHYFLVCPGVSLSGFYRQATSIGAFENREAQRICDAEDKGKTVQWCNVQRAKDVISNWRMHDELNDEFDMEDDLENPDSFIRVEGVWDFYKLIGYDYKAKKYIKKD